MKLSPAAELAVRGCLVLTEHHGQGPTTLAEICKASELSREYLAKVFGMLSRADIIQPIRGKHGGYVLAHDPSEINLLQIIEAVEGPQALNLCQFDPPKCENVETCKVQAIWRELQQVFNEKLASMTLDQCV